MSTPMTTEQAVLQLRQQPQYARLFRDAYLGGDVHESAELFFQSGEFDEVRKLVGNLADTTVLDLGAGSGIATYAFVKSGARRVYALEPDPSEIVGQGAIRQITLGMPVEIIGGYGEEIALPDGCIDLVYARQVLHHTRDLARVLRECARVLKKGGTFLACREHVVDNEAQLTAFLQKHPLHSLTGGENAFSLPTYLDAIHQAGLEVKKVLAPWDTVINIFPAVRTTEELKNYPRMLLKSRFGPLGNWLGGMRYVRKLVVKRLNRPTPGRMYSFVAHKP